MPEGSMRRVLEGVMIKLMVGHWAQRSWRVRALGSFCRDQGPFAGFYGTWELVCVAICCPGHLGGTF